jgi:hypothetical protein
VRKGITLTVGGQQTLNFEMKVGGVNEKVEVTGEAPVVQTTSSDISAVVNSTTVRELPLNGRSWTDLTTLQPGVTRIETAFNAAAGADRGERGFGTQLSISGGKPAQNNYRLDGVSVNDFANGAPGSVLGVSLGVDAFQEFSVSTTNYSADYGRTSGGVVNAITRSGPNEFKGSAFEFFAIVRSMPVTSSISTPVAAALNRGECPEFQREAPIGSTLTTPGAAES